MAFGQGGHEIHAATARMQTTIHPMVVQFNFMAEEI
jgi:hypothetical protein